MKAVVNYEGDNSYEIKDIISVQFVKGVICFTYLDDNNQVQQTRYTADSLSTGNIVIIYEVKPDNSNLEYQIIELMKDRLNNN